MTNPKSQQCQAERLLLAAPEAAHLCGTSERTWRTWDSGGLIPKSVTIGRSKFWRRRELEAWIAHGCPDRATWTVIFDGELP